MPTISVDTTVFKNKLREYAMASRRSVADAIKEEGRLTAQRLMQMTPPKTAKIGKAWVENDVGRIYIAQEWFDNVFNFKNQKFADKLKSLLGAKNDTAIAQVFERCPTMSKVMVDQFSPSTVQRYRKHGRVPKSFKPLLLTSSTNSSRKSFVKQKQKAIGTAKSGWGRCYADLGGSLAGWLNKASTGRAADQSKDRDNPYVLLTNSVPYAASLMSRMNIMTRALQGKQRDMEKKLERIYKEGATIAFR